MTASERDHEAIRWLWYALEDLSVARALVSTQIRADRHQCWLSQQAVEKALKAILVYEGGSFPRTHDLALLRSLVGERWGIRQAREGLTRLSAFAAEARYPGEWEEATLEDATFALDLAAGVVLVVHEEMQRLRVAGLDDLATLVRFAVQGEGGP